MKRILNFAAPIVALALIFGSCAQETTTFPASTNKSKVVVMNGLTGSSEASIDIVIGDDIVISGLSSLDFTSAFEVDPGTEEMLVLINDEVVATETLVMEEGEAAMLVITTTVDGAIVTIQENMPTEEEIAELTSELNAPFNLVTVINASASAGPITVQFDLESIGFVTLDGLGMDALNFGDAATIPMNDGTEVDQYLQVIAAGSEAITGALLDAQVAAEEAAIEEQIAEMLDLMLGTDLMLDLNIQSESDFEILVEGMESMDPLGTVEGIQADAEAAAAEQMVAVEDAVAGVEQPSAEDLTYTIIITGDGSGADQTDITVIDQSVTGLMAE